MYYFIYYLLESRVATKRSESGQFHANNPVTDLTITKYSEILALEMWCRYISNELEVMVVLGVVWACLLNEKVYTLKKSV